MNSLLQDLRFGLRFLSRSPASTLTALLALSLGVGANAALFSVVHAVLLRPLPYYEPNSLVQVWERRASLGRERNPVSPADFFDWRDGNQAFEHLAAYTGAQFNTTGGPEPERLNGAAVSADLFPLLRVTPLLGRGVLPAEESFDAPGVVILSHALWRERFGSDASVLGRALLFNGRPRTVVGVMPPGFHFPDPAARLWIPLALDPAARANRALHYLSVVARLRPGVSVAQAAAEMHSVAARLEADHPVNRGHGVNLFPLHEETVGTLRTPLLVLFAAVALILLIACSNVAHLMLVRAADRRSEMAIRTALGAGSARILRQLMTEAVLLALLSGCAGLLLAMWGMDLLTSLTARHNPRAAEIRLDRWVLAFNFGISVLSGLFFGLLPALRARRADLIGGLKETKGAVGLRESRWRGAMIAVQVALSVVLLVGAGLLMRSFFRLMEVPSGFNPANVLTAEISLAGPDYELASRRAAFYDRLLQGVLALPGVQGTALVSDLPMSGASAGRYFRVEGRPPRPPGEGLNARFNLVSHGYFQTLGIPLLQGREFTAGDGPAALPVTLINQSMARRFWPGEDPLGQRLAVGDEPWRTIVGIVGDVRHRGPATEPEPEMYRPYMQHPLPFASLVVRTAANPAGLAPALKDAVRAVDRHQPLHRIRTLEEVVAGAVSGPRLNMSLMAAFGGTALLLSATGLYGVLAYRVSRRRREIGVCMALGARPAHIFGGVVRQGMSMALIGIVAGLAVSVWLTRFLESLLFGVTPLDAQTLAGVGVLMAGVALLACYLPARRATRVDPMTVLRCE